QWQPRAERHRPLRKCLVQGRGAWSAISPWRRPRPPPTTAPRRYRCRPYRYRDKARRHGSRLLSFLPPENYRETLQRAGIVRWAEKGWVQTDAAIVPNSWAAW